MTLNLSKIVVVALTGLQVGREGQAVLELEALGDVLLLGASVSTQQGGELYERTGTGFQAHSISGRIDEEMALNSIGLDHATAPRFSVNP